MSPAATKKQAENSGAERGRGKRQRNTNARNAMPKMNIPTRERLASARGIQTPGTQCLR